jgi:hypothetical protein
MRTQKWLRGTSVLATLLTAVIVLPVSAQIPVGVSPGAPERVTEIEGRCPTFIWGVVPGAERYEIAGYRIPEGSSPTDLDPSQAEQVLYNEVQESVTSWVPNLEQCLAPEGNFVWFVRAALEEEDGEILEASEWSEGRYFSISSRPSVEEVEEALRVLRRYSSPEGLSATVAGEPQRLGSEKPGTQPPSFPNLKASSVTTAKTAIRAGVPDDTGENYGIVGLSNSPNGAGLAAANTNGGPDLVLDGSADSNDPDAVFTQAGIDRADSTDTSFSLLNSDPTGKLNLDVEGTITGDGSGLTNLNASQLSSGTVPNNRLSGTYSSPIILSNVTATGVISGDGTGLTNLDADHLSAGTIPNGRLAGTYSNGMAFENIWSIKETDNNGETERWTRSEEDPVQNQWYDIIGGSYYAGFSTLINALYEDNSADSRDVAAIFHVGAWGGSWSAATVSELGGTGRIQVRVNCPGGSSGTCTIQIRQTHVTSSSSNLTYSVSHVRH